LASIGMLWQMDSNGYVQEISRDDERYERDGTN
jgi:hypothetical protein